jgi:inosine/xanthosine triphosphatase
MTKIIIASKNPVKIESTRAGFAKMFKDEIFEIEGLSVDSGVSAQPTSEEETLKGATNRVNNVFNLSPDADYWVGIEGGSKIVGEGMETFAWVVIKSKNGRVSQGRTASFYLPKEIVTLVRQGKELGEADDIVFKRSNSKQSNGAVGILTGDVLTRTDYYETAVILALIPFKNPKLY